MAADAGASRAKIAQARKQAAAAQAARRTASAGEAIASQQVAQQSAGTAVARVAAREAVVVQGCAQIASPADGVVTARRIAPGTLVQPGTFILKIAEIGKVRLQANVAASDLAGIHVGSSVQASVPDGSGVTINAHVTAIFPSADPSTRTAVVEVIISNPGKRRLPGQFVTMKIAKSTMRGKLLAPADAVVTRDGQSVLWTVDGQIAKKIAVSVGASDGASTEVSGAGLSAGMRVVTHGQAALASGMRVAPAACGANGPAALPTAAMADPTKMRYKCVICGLTYSAADAKADHYVCPMDHGKLLPIKPAPSRERPNDPHPAQQPGHPRCPTRARLQPLGLVDTEPVGGVRLLRWSRGPRGLGGLRRNYAKAHDALCAIAADWDHHPAARRIRATDGIDHL